MQQAKLKPYEKHGYSEKISVSVMIFIRKPIF